MRAMLISFLAVCFTGCWLSHERDMPMLLPATDAAADLDAGSPIVDSGRAELDAGPLPAPDAGPITSDAGTPEEDAAEPEADASADECATDEDCAFMDVGCRRYRCTWTTLSGPPYCFPGEWDSDGDGHSVAADGFSAICGDDDCNDIDPGVHPDAAETCDGRDEDCDGVIDEDACVEPLLTVALDSATPVAHQLVMGSVGEETLRIRLTSGPETLTFTQTALLVAIGHRGAVWNIRYMDAERGTYPAGTLAALPSDGPVLFVSPGTFVLLPHTTAVIKIVVDVTGYIEGGVSGETFRFGFGPDARMEAYVGLDGRRLAPEEIRVEGAGADGAIWGNWMTIYRTKLTVARHSSSPSGTTTGAADQTVAMFVFSNSTNVGYYEAMIEGFAPRVNSTIVTSMPRTIRVWKDAVGPAANLLGEVVVPAGETLDTLTPPWYLSLPFGPDVSAASSRTVIVTADTQDARPDNRLTVDLPVASVAYSDGVSHGIQPDSLPITGNTLTY